MLVNAGVFSAFGGRNIKVVHPPNLGIVADVAPQEMEVVKDVKFVWMFFFGHAGRLPK